MAHTLAQFAESILFSASLAEKLAAPPPELSDPPASGLPHLPALPARPPELRWKQRGHPFRFPRRIDSERDRGLLLHHMANHELLAVELMALALLKFPDAPSTFRRGLLHTLTEEQEHTRWYLERMQSCGVAFGELPVSGFFWRMIAPMRTPMEYVARLSLTFEQANLDYSKTYATLFAGLGDRATAALFERIHIDEIGHVRYGWHWFRKWKPADQSDWEAFTSALGPSIPPVRARGPDPADREARLRAGIPQTFIRRLRIEPPLPTRPVVAHWINPGPDALVDGQATAQAVFDALSFLPVAWMREGDVLFANRQASLDWLEALADIGLPVPRVARPGLPAGLRVDHLEPWAWTDAARALEASLAPAHPHAPPTDDPDSTRFDKTRTAEFRRQVALPEFGLATRHFGETIDSLPALAGALDVLRLDGFDTALLKAPLSCAGRHRRRVPTNRALGARDFAWIAAKLARHGRLLVEPWFQRLFDFSLHFDLEPDGPRFRGAIRMINTPAGTWRACIAQPALGAGTPYARFLHEGSPSRLQLLTATLQSRLPEYFGQTAYRGPTGVDAFLCRLPSGEIALHPLAEINPRRTLGRALLDAMRHTHPGRSGRIRFEPRIPDSPLPQAERDAAGALLRARIPLDGGTAAAGWIPVWTVVPDTAELEETKTTAAA